MIIVLFDLRWMCIGRSGGMEQLAYELVTTLSQSEDRVEILVYCPEATFGELRLNGCEGDITLIDSDLNSLIPETELFDKKFKESSECGFSRRLGVVPKLMNTDGLRILEVDIIHSIGGYISSEFHGFKNVATILDLQHRHFPEFFEASEVEVRECNHQLALQLSEKIICISEYVRRDVLSHFNVPKQKAQTIWPIPSGYTWMKLPEGFARSILKRIDVGGDYLFYPAHAWRHKNHGILLDAFASLRERFPKLKLVLAGGEFASDHSIQSRIKSKGLMGSVVHLGYCTPLELCCLLREARAMVYPSKFEGFGLPVAEAIISGTPVVCSDIEALNEVGSNAVTTFDPDIVLDLVRAIERTLSDSDIRRVQLERARKRKSLFAAGPIVLRTINVYRELCGLKVVDQPSNIAPPSLRNERARHWGRKASSCLSNGHPIQAWTALIKAFCLRPRYALAVYRASRENRRNAPQSFEGRYGDGWIGPKYSKWLMVPEGASSLVLRIEYPPRGTCSNARMSLSIDDGEPTLDTFSGCLGATITIPLQVPSTGLVLLKIKCQHQFVPKDLGQSEDDRALSARLLDIQWR